MQVIKVGNKQFFTDVFGEFLYFHYNNDIISYFDEVKKEPDGEYSKQHQKILTLLTNKIAV